MPGHARSQALLRLVESEIKAGLRQRGPEAIAKQEAYHAHIARLMDNSAGNRTYSDKTGNCRLRWVDRMVRQPVTATLEADLFTRQLHAAATDERDGMHRVLDIAAARMDLGPIDHARQGPPALRQADTLIGHVNDQITAARQAFQEAIAALTSEQVAMLETRLYPVSTRDIRSGATFSDRAMGRQVTDQLEQIDHENLYAAAHALLELADPVLLRMLAKIHPLEDTSSAIDGVTGRIKCLFNMGQSTILRGGTGRQHLCPGQTGNGRCRH